MSKRIITRLCLSLVTALMVMGNVASAQDSELKFVSNVSAVADSGDGTAIITIMVRGIAVDVDVTSDTEVEIGNDSLALAKLSPGDSVEIEAFFSNGRIVAEEISLLDRGEAEFRFKGEVTAVDFDAVRPGGGVDPVIQMTLLGSDVFVDEDALIIIRGEGRVGRGRSDQTSFANLEQHLATGDDVDVRGTYDGTALWATDLKIGNRDDGEIELEGTVQALTNDGFIIFIADAGEFTVVTDENTEVEGELSVGAAVEVEGMLMEDVAILAFEVESDEDEDEDEEEDED